MFHHYKEPGSIDTDKMKAKQDHNNYVIQRIGQVGVMPITQENVNLIRKKKKLKTTCKLI